MARNPNQPWALVRRGCRVRPHSAGFTLIELIVVIVIIGILVGFVVVSMNRTAPDSVNACRAQMQSWLETQAVNADMRGRTVYIINGGSAPSAIALVADAAPPAPVATPSSNAAGSAGLAPAQTSSTQSAAAARTAPKPPRTETISTLNWPSGCRIEPPITTGASPFEAGDPRAQAILAVTSGGVWSAPPNGTAGNAHPGKPTLEVTGAPAQRGAPNPPQVIDLSPAPVGDSTTGATP